MSNALKWYFNCQMVVLKTAVRNTNMKSSKSSIVIFFQCNSLHAITQIEINMIFKVLIKKFKLYNPATVVFLIKG